MKRIIYGLLILSLVLLMTNCKSYEKRVYFQGEDGLTESPSDYTPVFKTDDYLSVIVTADDPLTAAPFNFPPDLSANNQMRGGQNMQLGMPVNNGYLVDDEGYVNLPVLGRIQVAGMTRKKLIKTLEKRYDEYLQNPIVNVKIMNFKITVLGDVKNPGTFIVPNERVTILEAIGLAGDLKMTGERDNILVIRDRGGTKTQYRLDLTSKDALSSPVFYLEQNDLVYVEPNIVSRIDASPVTTLGNIFISFASFALSVILIITR